MGKEKIFLRKERLAKGGDNGWGDSHAETGETIKRKKEQPIFDCSLPVWTYLFNSL